MITLLSPAKTLDFETPAPVKSATKPAMLDRSEQLVDDLRDLSAMELSSLMGISERLGELNHRRFAEWTTPFTKANSKPALFAFKGDVYVGLDAQSLTEDDLEYAQKHIRILSGLYGVLRPLDLIQPYRLEMGTRFKNEEGNDLYEFWGDDITAQLNRQIRALKTDTVVNLASVEYFKSVNHDALKARVVSPVFRDRKNGTYKIISFYAKKARGLMAGWIVKNQVEDPGGLEAFDVAGYDFSRELSTPEEPVFLREKKPN